MEYEKEFLYFAPDGKTLSFHTDFVLQGKTEQIRIVIEIDGEQHQKKDAMINDAMRDSTLKEMGYIVLRFTTGDLRESLKGCIEKIKRVLDLEEIRLIEAAQKKKVSQLKQKGVL